MQDKIKKKKIKSIISNRFKRIQKITIPSKYNTMQDKIKKRKSNQLFLIGLKRYEK